MRPFSPMQLPGLPGYRAIQALPREGRPHRAAVLVAEIGDITRFANLELLCSWASVTPRHYESSNTTVRRGYITKRSPSRQTAVRTPTPLRMEETPPTTANHIQSSLTPSVCRLGAPSRLFVLTVLRALRLNPTRYSVLSSRRTRKYQA